MNRVRRFTAYGSVNSLPWLDQRKPFFDNDLVELIFSIPDKYRANNRIYSEMLQKFFPEFFRDIPWQHTGKPAAIVRPKSFSYKAVRKVYRVLKSSLGVKSTLGYTDYPAWIRDEEIASQLYGLLDYESAEYRVFINEDLSKKWLSPHIDKKIVNYSQKILRIATVELYLKKVKKAHEG